MKLLGQVCCVAFWDHSSSDGNSAGPILCTVYGRLHKADKLSFQVICWDLPDCADGSKEHNQEIFTILRSTIVKMFVFGKGREVKKFK